jgi:hypothetical protein
MTTDKQIEANRANAQKSTGPRTETGKAKSRYNATKHGLTGQQIVLDGEDPDAFEEMKADLFQTFDPVGPAEERLVASLAQNLWRLHRAPGWEDALLAKGQHDLAEARHRTEELFGIEKSELAADEKLAKLYPHRTQDDLKHRALFGHVLENNLPALNRLGTYEARLAGRVKQDFTRLRELQAFRRENAQKMHEDNVGGAEQPDVAEVPAPGSVGSDDAPSTVTH